MAIEKEYGKFVPVCEACGKTLPPVETFEDAKEAMKAAGWKLVRSGEFWDNYCTDCQED